MRALILVATAALALSACSREEAANNVTNVDETMNETIVTNDTGMMDMNADANMDMNADANVDANATANDTTNNAM